jgi:hypothetical protein
MNVITRDPSTLNENCPKRLWVMTVLSDDEAQADAGGVSTALNLHLASCAPCRELADRLLRVGNLLGALASVSPAPALISGADVQLARALDDGAMLTGRVAILDAPAQTLPVRRAARAMRFAGYAAAAMVAIAVTTGFVVRLRNGTSGQTPQGTSAAALSDRQLNSPHRDNTDAPSPPPYLARSPLDPDPTERLTTIEHHPAGRQCFHSSALEAAECERIHGMHQAMGLGFRSERPGSVDPPLDKSRNAVSTPGRADRP